jgi:hypothetical protein
LSDQSKRAQRDAFQGATVFASGAKQSSGATVTARAVLGRVAALAMTTGQSPDREAAVNGRSLDRI